MEDDYLIAAKKYAKRYLSHTEDYRSNKDNAYYYITVFSQHLAKKAWKNPEYRKRIKEIIKNFKGHVV